MGTPYQASAVVYAEAGWSPVPLPFESKYPVPDGTTGARGIWIDIARAREWSKPKVHVHAGKMAFRPTNVALRLPPNVIGVDVDAYGEKAGETTLAAAEKRWGKLPATHRTTSREDGVSGIRLFRIPEGLAWPESLREFGGGVELIRWDHRYAIVEPSVHDKTKAMYRWIGPDGEFTDEIPEVVDLPELPQKWVEGLTSGKRWEERASADLDEGEALEWITGRPNGEMCSEMTRTLTRYSRGVREAGDDGGAHDVARDGAWALLGDSAAGHVGVAEALNKLRKVFLVAVAGRRGSEGEAASEWKRMVIRGVSKVVAEGDVKDDDICEALSSEGSPKKRKVRGSSAFDYKRDDIGNAQRLFEKIRHDARWVKAWDSWVFWSGGRWDLDVDGQVERWAMDMVRDMEDEAKFIEDPKERATFMKFVRSSGNSGKLQAMLRHVKAMKGMTVPVERFDSIPELLGCKGNVLVLGESGLTTRPAKQEDLLTLNTLTEYDSAARSGLWDKYLSQVQPDPEMRNWLQLLIGYSMQRGNPLRIMVFGKGPTTTGKSTFIQAIVAALGNYADETSMTVFRDNQDERPRADLVRALPKHIVFGEEASAAWHMHPDQIKRLTGGGAIMARIPHARTAMSMIPSFTPWIMTNSMPNIPDADAALFQRLMVVPFEERIKRQDATFNDKLREEAVREAVLAWAVAGWQRWVARPESIWQMPEKAAMRLMEAREELSDVTRFIADSCDVAGDYWVDRHDLYEEYQRWCDLNGVSARDTLSGVAFGRQLTGLGYSVTSTKQHPSSMGVPYKVRGGLRLRVRTKK